MGIYLFRCRGAPFFKLGHHLATPRRPNPYYRIAGRGFYGCVHPPELDGLLGVADLELVAWYPTLGRSDEREAHRLSSDRVGEFHPLERLDALLAHCDGRGAREAVSSAGRRRALAWGARRARKARRARQGRC